MAQHKENRRKFIQRMGFMLAGATVGGVGVAKTAPPEAQQAPAGVVDEPVPVEPEIHEQPKPPEPPSGKRRTLLEQWQNPEPPLAEQKKHAQKHEKRRRQEPRTTEERIVRGAVLGGVGGLAVHAALSVNSKESAEAGATQNDPERVEWERYQQRERDRQERERHRNRDHEV